MFGNIIHGRDIRLEGAHTISDPCVTLSPIRITMPPSKQVLGLVRHVQDQYMQAMPYSNIDFETIRQHATPWPAKTFFSSLVTHQNNGDIAPSLSLHGQEWDMKVHNWLHPWFSCSDAAFLPGPATRPLSYWQRKINMVALEDLLDRFCSAI